MGRTIMAMVAALTLLLGACGGGGDEGVADQPQTGQSQTGQSEPGQGDQPATEASGQGGSDVAVQGFRFQPATLQVAAGGTVTWTNEDDINHTATAGTPDAPTGEFDVDLPQKGATGEHTFDEPGTYAYFCEVHPSMTGEIVVS
ncbi:MAG TPA: plastocyanin/azurin family copper-binding protein [Egibacteraceae bacterium]|nr:plastocyanin/azurin family copper-binding protein [Egibacteraceae bacterium]